MTEITGYKVYDVDECVAEIYDQTETQTEDVRLLRELLAGLGQLRILEPFCGNGRILIPLAQDGHEVVGIDKSKPMLESAKRKLQNLPESVTSKVRLIQANVLDNPWPRPFDVVILGANCFYELPTSESQELCIRRARGSLRDGGYLFLDNNHMEGELDPSWCEGGIHRNRFPTGRCCDGTHVEGTTETIWFDKAKRLVRFRRSVKITPREGDAWEQAWIEQKHPPSTGEMSEWLSRYGFEGIHLWGDRRRSPYTDDSGRAVFWAKLTRR
jgi:SAM-dependent methyltransferase